MEFSGVTEILGGVKVLQREIHNRMDFIELSNNGISKFSLLLLAKYLDLSLSQMAQLLAITERTIQRYTPETHFNRIVSEQILQIAEVAARGTNVFGDKDKFRLWMNQPNKALADLPPIRLMGSRFGTEMILDELGRIDYGVFS